MGAQNTSPAFYRNAAILFSIFGGILVWAAIARHDRVYWWFAGITIVNALMSTLKFYQVRETKS